MMKPTNCEITIDEILEIYSEFEEIEDFLPGLKSVQAFRVVISAIYDVHGYESFESIRLLVHTICDIKDFIDEKMNLDEIKKREVENASRKEDYKKAQELLKEAALLMRLKENHFIYVRPDIRKKEQEKTTLIIGQRLPHIEGESVLEYRTREGRYIELGSWGTDKYIFHSGTRGAAADAKRAAKGMAVKMLFSCLPPIKQLKNPYAHARDILKYCGFNTDANNVQSIALSAGYNRKKALKTPLPNWP